MRPIVAIDGPAGCGKSTVASGLAKALGYLYLDTGAMYRAVALKSMRAKVCPNDATRLGRLARQARVDLKMDPGRKLRVLLDGKNVTKQIRTSRVTARASEVARVKAVRQAMVKQQRRIAKSGRVVAEGRDIGTVVFPDAAWKFYLTASASMRAQRRWRDLKAAGETIGLKQVLRETRARDRRDKKRKISPLKPARGAFKVDTTRRMPKGTLKVVLNFVRCHPLGRSAARG